MGVRRLLCMRKRGHESRCDNQQSEFHRLKAMRCESRRANARSGLTASQPSGFRLAAQAVVPRRFCGWAVVPPSIRLAKSIAREWRLRPRQLRRSAATRSSKAFPICSLAAARAKARKLDTKCGVLQNSPSVDDRRWLLKNIGGRNSNGPSTAPSIPPEYCCRKRESSCAI